MSKFHITAKGDAAPCTASLKACPRGGADAHYATAEDARAAYEASAARATIPATPQRTDQEIAREAFWKGLETNARGVGFEQTGYADEMTDEFEERLEAAFAKPLRYTPAQRKRISALCAEHSVTPEEVEAWAASLNRMPALPLRGRTLTYAHPSRHLFYKHWYETYGQNVKERSARGFTEENVRAAAEWVRQGRKSSDVESTDTDPRHFYGAWARSAAQPVEPTKSSSAGPKELDPELVEALRRLYLKKFKVDPFEQGMTVPELLKMKREGVI